MKVQEIEILEGLTDKVGNKWQKREVKYKAELSEEEGQDINKVREITKSLRETIQGVVK